MGLLSGGATFQRFTVGGSHPAPFDVDEIEQLDSAVPMAASDWSAGGHELDRRFDLAKNRIGDALAFDLRTTTNKLPVNLLKAYYEIDLAALAAGNPSGLPSARQKREAKESARERLAEEGRDGRFLKRKCVPVLWSRADGASRLYFGSTSVAAADHLMRQFQATFDRDLTPLTAGRFAERFAASDLTLGPALEAAKLTAFANRAGDHQPDAPDWSPRDGRDWLGNELLLWLWWYTDRVSDTFGADDLTLMFARTLTLEDPRGISGTDQFSHEGPTRLPEARRAIRAGKLPRKAGFTAVWAGDQFEFTLQAETLAVTGGKLPPAPEGATGHARLEHRVEMVERLGHLVDTLFDRFLTERLDPHGWAKRTEEIAAWAETLG
jgi:hypothetical protein